MGNYGSLHVDSNDSDSHRANAKADLSPRDARPHCWFSQVAAKIYRICSNARFKNLKIHHRSVLKSV